MTICDEDAIHFYEKKGIFKTRKSVKNQMHSNTKLYLSQVFSHNLKSTSILVVLTSKTVVL